MRSPSLFVLSAAFSLPVALLSFATLRAQAQPAPPKDSWREEALKAGSAVLEKHQCTRCHNLSEEKEWPREMSCRGCHTWIEETRQNPELIKERKKEYPLWDRYLRNVKHFSVLPDLSYEGERVRADFIEAYLANPFDVRPMLEETMIRNTLSPEEIKTLVRYFAARGGAPDPYEKGRAQASKPSLPEKDESLVSKGEELFGQKGCASCHVFGNKDFQTQVDLEFLQNMRPLSSLAPDLRFARDKVRPDIIVDWIMDPTRIDPGTLMPKLDVSQKEAEALAQFLFYGDPGPWAKPKAEAASKKRKGRITYTTLDREIFTRICIHCHMDTGRYDDGAGNSGGLGYAGKGLSFTTKKSFLRGSKQKDGSYASVLRPGKSGKPVLLERLERRVEENRRDHVLPFSQTEDHSLVPYPQEGPGMPLGLPALTDEQLQMIRDWIDNGAPGPDGKSMLP